jgi:hypothetical protein
MASFSQVENLFSVSACAELSIECAKLRSITSAKLLFAIAYVQSFVFNCFVFKDFFLV